MVASRSEDDGLGETALPGLKQGAVEHRRRHVQLAYHLAVHLDRALVDEPARLAGRRDPQVLDEHCGKMRGLRGLELDTRDLLGRLPLAHDTREVLLCPARLLFPPRAR